VSGNLPVAQLLHPVEEAPEREDQEQWEIDDFLSRSPCGVFLLCQGSHQSLACQSMRQYFSDQGVLLHNNRHKHYSDPGDLHHIVDTAAAAAAAAQEVHMAWEELAHFVADDHSCWASFHQLWWVEGECRVVIRVHGIQLQDLAPSIAAVVVAVAGDCTLFHSQRWAYFEAASSPAAYWDRTLAGLETLHWGYKGAAVGALVHLQNSDVVSDLDALD
jgi:hypothetical protein